MCFRKIIFVAATIVIIFENADADWKSDCIEQLITKGQCTVDDTSSSAFKKIYDKMIVPERRSYNMRRKGIRYEYQDHLYMAILSIDIDAKITSPENWCLTHILDYYSTIYEYTNDIQSICKIEMEKVGFDSTAKNALNLSFYRHLYSKQFTMLTRGYFNYIRNTLEPLIKDTNAKSPMEFCNENEPPARPVEQYYNVVFDPSQQYHQLPDHQNEPHTFDLNFPPAVSTSLTHSSEYPSYYGNITSTSTSNADEIDYLGFDLNKLPPEEYEENEE